MADLIWLVPVLPLIGTLVNGLVITGLGRGVQRRMAGVIASVCSGLAFVVALVIAVNLSTILGGEAMRDVIGASWIALEGSPLNIPYGLRIDPLSVTMMLVVTGVGTLIHIFSIGYMAEDERVGRYFTYLNLFMVAMLLLVLANNFLLMFVGWEGVGLCSYLLIGFWFERDSAAQAGKKAFLVNRVGDFGFLLAMFAILALTGSLVFNTPEHTGALDRAGQLAEYRIWGFPAVMAIALLLLLACTGKSAQLPLYLWLPDAMEGPTPVSALIHAATMVTAGVYLVARAAPIFGQSPEAMQAVAWVGIITALYAAIIAIKQYDIKRVLAYSTVSQLGYMFVGVGVGAYSAGISHLVTHSFFKALMFLGAGAVMHSLEGQLDLRKMGGLKKHLKVTYWTFLFGLLAIIGVPFTSGWFSKDLIIESAFEHGEVAIGWLAVLVAALTAFYMCRMFLAVFHGDERIEMGDEGRHGEEHGHRHAHAHVHPEQRVMNLPLVALAVLSAVGGVVVHFLPQFLHPVTAGLMDAVHAGEGAAGGEHGAAHVPQFRTSIVTIYAGVAMLAGAGSALLLGANRLGQTLPAAAERALGFLQNLYEGACHAIFVRGGTFVSEIAFKGIDRMIVDRAVDGVGGFAHYLAESLRTLQTGYVRNYALVMLAGSVFVVACFLVILQMSYTFDAASKKLRLNLPSLVAGGDTVNVTIHIAWVIGAVALLVAGTILYSIRAARLEAAADRA